MSFNDNANLDTSQVETGGGGGGRGGLAIGGGVGGIIVLILTLLLGGNVTGGGTDGTFNPGQDTQLNPGQVQPGGAQVNDFAQCRTGADANRDVQCRVIGTVNSVQGYWAQELPRYGTKYRKVNTVLYSGATASACGTASNQVGPFYCPLDKKVYIDASFFAELTSRFGADSGALAQEYVVAHEYGHAIQDQLGILDRARQDPQGQSSGAVRIELMADCLGGVWAKHASQTTASNGQPLLKPLTQTDIQSALSAASAVGDDRIQKKLQGRVTPESWTHGSSAERQKWFSTGYQTGDLNQCDTFTAASLG
ncbi:MAG: neutral zinc metallopeptidase [Dermatophilaceae bacterium]